MDLDIRQHIPEEFNEDSRVWIYQSSRLFLISEALELEEILNSFVEQWTSHGATVKGYANLFFGRFIILIADETATGVSGCSTDSSVRLLKSIEEKFDIQLFDRQSLAFILKDKIEIIPMQQVTYAIQHKFITENTLFFNNTITSKKDLVQKWIVPASETWLSRYFSHSGPVGS